MTNSLFITKELHPHLRPFTPPKETMGPFFSKGKKGIALALALLGSTSYHCQGAEPVSSGLFWTLGSYVLSPITNFVSDQIPEETKNNIYKMTIGSPKDFDEVLKEFTFNRWKTELRDLIEKKIFEIHKSANDLSENQPIRGNFNFMLPKVSEYAVEAKKYSFRYSLATLSLDYTHECKLLIEKKIEKLTEKVSRPNNGEEKIILDYLNHMKKNLCGNLYAKYHYERGGGGLDRYNLSSKAHKDRKKYWGWSEKPPTNNSHLPENVKAILYGDGYYSIKNDLQREWNSYQSTITFLGINEIDLVDDYYNHRLESYYNDFVPLFDKQPQRDTLPCKLIEDFDKKLNEGWTPPLYSKTAPVKALTTESRPIPGKGRGQEISGAASGSFSTESPLATKSHSFIRSDSYSDQASSLPVNFGAAVEKHYKQENISLSYPGIEKKIPQIQVNIPQGLPTQPPIPSAVQNKTTPLAFQMNAFDDYEPKVPSKENIEQYDGSDSDSLNRPVNEYSDQSDSFSSSDEFNKSKGKK